jgi:hypothetical protein
MLLAGAKQKPAVRQGSARWRPDLSHVMIVGSMASPPSQRARYAPAAPALAMTMTMTMTVGTGPFGRLPAGTAMLLIPDGRPGPISQTVEQELPQPVGEK